jgi:hypothetical protein
MRNPLSESPVLCDVLQFIKSVQPLTGMLVASG